MARFRALLYAGFMRRAAAAQVGREKRDVFSRFFPLFFVQRSINYTRSGYHARWPHVEAGEASGMRWKLAIIQVEL